MTIIAESQRMQIKSSRRWVTLGLILGLLALRYFVTAARIIFPEPPGWILPAFEVGTYLLVSIFIIKESKFLDDYHISNLALWMLILFKPIETMILSIWNAMDPQANFPLAFPKLPSLLIWAIALVMFVVFRKRLIYKGAILRKDWKWLVVGGLVGLAFVLVMAYPMSFVVSPVNPGIKLNIFSTLLQGLATIPYQIGYAAISEEPVFRGFLWGVLRKNGWRDLRIWLFQGLLFVLAHLYYVKSAPISFWFIVPLSSLILGWLAWRSRSIATSMAAHGTMNGLGYTLGYIAAVFRS